MLCVLFATVHRHIFCSSWSRGISQKSWACKKICIACSKSVFSKIFSWIVGVWYWKTAILSIALRIRQHEDINLTNQRMIPESGIMERQRQSIKGMSPGSADLSPSTIHHWWSFFPIWPQNALLCLQLKTKMVSSHSYTSEEVLNEMFADAESDLKSGEREVRS